MPIIIDLQSILEVMKFLNAYRHEQLLAKKQKIVDILFIYMYYKKLNFKMVHDFLGFSFS